MAATPQRPTRRAVVGSGLAVGVGAWAAPTILASPANAQGSPGPTTTTTTSTTVVPPSQPVVVSVGDDAGGPRVWRSTDEGQTWALASTDPLPGGFQAQGLATDGAGTWVASGFDATTVAQAVVWRSITDADTWTGPVTLSGGTSAAGVANSGATWVAVGTGNSPQDALAWRSTDGGVSWSPAATTPLPDGVLARSVATDGSVWVAVGDDSNIGRAWRSTDGSTWVLADTNPLPEGGSVFDVAYRNGTWIAVGSSATGEPKAWRSTNGNTWPLATTNPLPSGSTAYGVDGDGAGTWVAVGRRTTNSTAVAWRSADDGLTWSLAATTPLPVGFDARGIARATTRWVAAGNSVDNVGRAWRSTAADGDSWVLSDTNPLPSSRNIQRTRAS